MTISSTTNTVSYNGNGSTTAFAVPYVFFGTGTTSEVQVVEVVIATGAETIKSNGSDFTVAGGSGATGTVTATVAPASTVKWVINRATTQTQETDYVENDPFPAESHEEALDRLTAIDQEQQRALDRTAQLPDGYTGAFDPTLPTAITGSTVLAFNAGATAFEVGPTTAAISGAAAEAAAAAASATAADASETAASASETAAGLSETAAAASEVNAATSESNAATSETNAATSESNASTSETNAATSETNAAASASAAEAAAAAVFWEFNTSTSMADPGTGNVRLNNATLASVTQIAVSALSASSGNPDVSDYITVWDDSTSAVKGYLLIRESGAPATILVFSITGTITDNTTWLQIPVTHVSSSGSLGASDDLYVSFSRSGDTPTNALLASNNLSDLDNTGTARTNLGLSIGSDVQAYDVDTLKADVSDTLTVGMLTTSYNLGSLSSATTLHISDGNIQYATMTGSFTLTAPDDATDGYLEVEFTIDGTGGYTLTLSGFNEVSGTAVMTANTVNLLRISKLNTNTYIEITQAV